MCNEAGRLGTECPGWRSAAMRVRTRPQPLKISEEQMRAHRQQRGILSTARIADATDQSFNRGFAAQAAEAPEKADCQYPTENGAEELLPAPPSCMQSAIHLRPEYVPGSCR